MSLFVDDLSPAPAETWWDYFQEHRDTYMAPQAMAWTCSICSADWLLRASGLNPYSTREQVTVQIGYPSCVDEWSGLKDTNCLVSVFSDYGVEAVIEWVDWPRLVEIASTTAAILNGLAWYHFVGVRGVSDYGTILIANSAEGYQGVYGELDAAQFNRLGPWQVVRLVH